MTYESTLWEEFIKYVNSDLALLEDRKKELFEKKEMAEKVSSYLSSVDSIIDNEDELVRIDSSISEPIKSLIFFRSKNNLSNLLAVSKLGKIMDSEKLKDVTNLPITLDSEVDSINNNMGKIESILDGKLEPRLIIEMAKSHNYDEESIKGLLFYPMYSKALSLNKEQAPVLTEEEIKEEKEIEEDVNASITHFNDLKEEATKHIENPLSKMKYEEAKSAYLSILSEEKEFLDKMYLISKEINDMYLSYATYDIDYIYELGLNERDLLNVLIKKMFILKDDSDLVLEELKEYLQNEDEFDSLDDIYNKAAEYLYNFVKVFDVVKNLDKKQEKEENIDKNKVFFAHDIEGNLLFKLTDDNVKRMQNYIEKFNSVKEVELDVNMKKLLGTEESEKKIDKNIYFLKENPTVAYVKIRYKGNTCIFMLTISSMDDIVSNINRVIKNNINSIINQISLIENDDPNEIETQTYIRNMFVEQDEVLGGR